MEIFKELHENNRGGYFLNGKLGLKNGLSLYLILPLFNIIYSVGMRQVYEEYSPYIKHG